MRAVLVHDKKTIKLFHRVPERIYKDDKNYIPHIKQDIEKVFDPAQNKLFNDGKAARWIFYNEKNELVGRIAAFINAKTAYTETQPTGGVGFFESINDQNVANFIFDHSKAWLEELKLEAMDGPINFGERNQFWGCLTKNFTDPNSYAMNYNPPYYSELFENYGFQTYFEQYLYKRQVLEPVQEVFIRKLNILMTRKNISCRNIEGMPLNKVADDFLTVYNGAWGGHDNFKPMKREAAMKIMKALKPVIDRRIVIFAFHGDEPIGFFVNIPELNEIFKFVDGDLNWIGKLKFLYHKWKGTPRTMVGIVFGVVKKWQGSGVEGAMIHWSGEFLKDKDIYDEIVMTWIGDFNPKMVKVCENLGASRYREMKTYRYLFDRTKEFERCPIIE